MCFRGNEAPKLEVFGQTVEQMDAVLGYSSGAAFSRELFKMQETVVVKAKPGEMDEEQPHFLIIGSAGPGMAVMRGIARDAAPPDLFDTDDRLNDPRNN